MHIGTTHPILATGYMVNAEKNSSIVAAQEKSSVKQDSGAVNVTISDNAKRIVEAEYASIQPLDELDDSESSSYPLEMYAIPQWKAQYYPKTLGSQGLGTSANWMTENYPKLTAASSAEQSEYFSLLKEHYQSLMDDHGIDSRPKHYSAMIADEASSNALRQDFEARVNGDERLVSLMQKLGMGPFHG